MSDQPTKKIMFITRDIDPGDPSVIRVVARNPNRLANYVACDFCGDPIPIVVYQADRMSTGEVRKIWRWCACIPCHRALTANNWGDLKLRVIRRLGMMMPGLSEDAVNYAVNTTFEHFLRDVSRQSPEGEDQ